MLLSNSGFSSEISSILTRSSPLGTNFHSWLEFQMFSLFSKTPIDLSLKCVLFNLHNCAACTQPAPVVSLHSAFFKINHVHFVLSLADSILFIFYFSFEILNFFFNF